MTDGWPDDYLALVVRRSTGSGRLTFTGQGGSTGLTTMHLCHPHTPNLIGLVSIILLISPLLNNKINQVF